MLIKNQKIEKSIRDYFKTHERSFCLENTSISTLPVDGKSLENCRFLKICRNKLTELPDTFEFLNCLVELDISYNKFREFPAVIGELRCLKVIKAYRNEIETLPDDVFCKLKCLNLLNLNHNHLKRIPDSIKNCSCLTKLFLDHNQLELIPVSLCRCTQLLELHLGYNCLRTIPEEIGALYKLRKLILHKNQLEYLPENVVDLISLKMLDVAANNIQIMPSEINEMALSEFYYEQNPILTLKPVSSEHVDEVMPLLELCIRAVSKQMQNKTSYLHVKIRHYPIVEEILEECGECVLCGCAYRDIWIECVEFVKINKQFKSMPKMDKTVPLRAAVCSHSCFNGREHNFYGVANLPD